MNLLKPYTIRAFADGKILWVNPQAPVLDVFRAFKREDGPLFVVQQLEDNRLVIMRSPELPVEFMRPTDEIIGKLPTLLDNEYAPVDNLMKAVITTQPVTDIQAWFAKFEVGVEGITALTLSTFARHTVKTVVQVPFKGFVPQGTRQLRKEQLVTQQA